jgi:hypothetical protein
MFVTELDGVKFIQGVYCNFIPIIPIQILNTTHNSCFGQYQFNTLADVKLAMAKQVKMLGANCVVDFKFKYDQKVGGFWAPLWSLDNVMWHGSGIVGKLVE